MGYSVDTKLGFGIALADSATDGFDEEDSPAWLREQWESDANGITIEIGGSCDDRYPIVMVKASVVDPHESEPVPFIPADDATQREWSAKVYSYLDQWGLRDKVRDMGAVPSYLVALYHSY